MQPRVLRSAVSLQTKLPSLVDTLETNSSGLGNTVDTIHDDNSWHCATNYVVLMTKIGGSNMKAINTRNDQRGFFSLSLGFALLAVFGTISAGIEMTHRDTEHQIALGTEVPEFERTQGLNDSAH
jgi:hypothetical protein